MLHCADCRSCCCWTDFDLTLRLGKLAFKGLAKLITQANRELRYTARQCKTGQLMLIVYCIGVGCSNDRPSNDPIGMCCIRSSHCFS
jgi:hypothetical protein